MIRRTLLLAALPLATRVAAQVVQAAPAAYEPPAVPREFRAAWVTPMWDRGFKDWPSAPGLSPDSQRAELRALLDHAVSIGLNAVILHVRLAGDALYPTNYAPWSAYLSGTSGVAPAPMYDPLAFAVSEAHARGLQLHAWFNPFRAMLPIFAGKAAPTHVTRSHPDWIIKYGSQTWIDPGNPAARKYVLETILDVVKRYDVDGVHIDDYFYPYRESRTIVRRVKKKRVRVAREIAFADTKSWQRYGVAKGWTNRDSWRRANIDDFIRTLYQDVKATKPTVLVGVSPFGIWRSGTPAGITGLDAFSEIYADERRWLSEGWVDYLAPQLYWEVSGVQDRFRALDAWWRTQNPLGRYIWPGLYTSHVYGGSDPWPAAEIQTQIATIRDARTGSNELPGHIHFRLAALFADNDRIAGQIASEYVQRALVPAFPWLGAATPASPVVSAVSTDGPSAFAVAAGDTIPVRWWLIQARGKDGVWTTSVRPSSIGQMTLDMFGGAAVDEIAVSAVGLTGAASTPAILTIGNAIGVR
jgi:uncharacterized lipoprotein YddW (UPF0748 family)